MKASLDPGDRQFLDQLHRDGGGSVQELCESMGVTATAVRHRLNRLQERRFVDRETIREGRGRPHHVYRVSESGLKEMGDNYTDLATILWKELLYLKEPEIRNRIFSRISDGLTKRYGSSVQGESLASRFEQLSSALGDQGFDVEVDESGSLPILRENNCPYFELASHDSTICDLEQEIFSRVLGTNIALTRSCMDGHNCCEFEVVPEEVVPEKVSVD